MLDNPRGSGGARGLVEQMQAARQEKANQPEPDERPTGGTEETEAVEAEESTEYEAEQHDTEEDDDSEVDDTAEYRGEVEDDDEAEDSEEPRSYRVKVDGEEIEVDLDELTSGYQRDRDYRKKTMELAEQRKAYEAQQAQLAEKVQELESLMEQTDHNIDWDELRDTDPSEYLRQKDLQEKRQKASEKQRQELQQQQQERMQQYVQQEAESLKKAMGPKWAKDSKLQQQDFDAANAYLDEMGVSQEERSQLADHRLWKMIFDAAKHHRLMQNKGKVDKQVKKAPKSVKPGQRPAPSAKAHEQAMEKLKKADKRNAADALVEAMRAKRGK